MKLVRVAVSSAVMLVAAIPASAQVQSGSYAFLQAVKNGDGGTASQMLRTQGSLVNARDGAGDTGLIISVRKREADWAALFLNNGADVNMAGAGGDTALIAAARIGFNEAAEWILQKRAKPDLANKQGETALILAVQQRNPKLIKLLLELGADPDKSDFSGHSARDYAARDSRNRQALTLIEAVKKAK